MIMQSQSRRAFVSVLAILPFAFLLKADNNGADPALTAAPGEPATACTACHTGTALNAGGGHVKIILPGDRTYTPGVTQHIKVEVSDPAQRRWGFELTARLASDPANAQAGDLVASDSNSQVICANGRRKPCASAAVIQFITHTLAGTRNGTTGGAQFEFDWTPPATDSGRITLYAAGNAANGDNRNSGDHIYTATVDLDPAAAAPPKPSIRTERGVVNAASLQPGIAPSSWITISGTNLSATTRTWTPADFQDGAPPTSLDGVSVSINGKAAFVQSISPARVTVLAAADDAVGPVEVRVTTNGAASDPASVELLPLSPALFVNSDGKHVLMTPPGESLIAQPDLMPSVKPQKTTAQPGESILLYGVGFGPTDPDLPVAAITNSDEVLPAVMNPLTVTIGGVPADISQATLVPGTLHLYQLVITVPQGLTDGDQPIVAQIAGASSPATADCCVIAIQQ